MQHIYHANSAMYVSRSSWCQTHTHSIYLPYGHNECESWCVTLELCQTAATDSPIWHFHGSKMIPWHLHLVIVVLERLESVVGTETNPPCPVLDLGRKCFSHFLKSHILSLRFIPYLLYTARYNTLYQWILFTHYHISCIYWFIYL